MSSTLTKITYIFFLLLFAASSYGRNYEIMELNEVLNPTTKSIAKTNAVDVERLRSLIYDLHPTVYFENQEINQFEQENPLKVEIFSNSTNLLTNQHMAFPSLELMVFKVASREDTSWRLDLSSLQQINNLRYIYIECSYNCDVSEHGKMFSNLGAIKVFYQIFAQE